MSKFTIFISSLFRASILIILIFFLFQISSLAQSLGTVQGVVTDALTNNPLPGANVVVLNQQIGAATQKDGSYKISLKPGKYTLMASFVSYKSLKVEITIESNKTTTQNFELVNDLVGTQEVIVLGSRRSDRTVTESSVPIDVITAKEIEMTGLTQTTELLKLLIPSYNAPENTITDGSDHVRPASLRGLGPDQVLVLVNGKRRYTSALVHVNGSIGRGSTGADLNALPASAIERIEVLRDGASAQYGSDAIAGVINIILKKRQGLDASVSVGQYVTSQERGYAEDEGLITGEDASTYNWDGKVEDVNISDGFSTSLHLGYGFNFLENGTFYLSGQYRKHNNTNRSGEDPRQQYFSINGSPDPRESSFDRINHIYGDAETEDIGVFVNGSIPLSDNLELYTFGGYSYRDGLSGGFYRRSQDNRNVRAIYPNGFLPKINTKINDGSIAAGLKGNIGGWNFDLSETFGGNTFNFNVVNSLNTSLGASSPTEFDAGSLKFLQSTTNLDFVNQFEIGTAAPLNVATGFEFRLENYQLEPGEPNSYIDGGVPILDGPSAGNSASVGAQVFPGFTPQNTQDENRTNIGLYVDLENNLLKNWTVGAAGRFENYSDFGSTLTGKFSTRYEFIKEFALRGAVSTGFRAPSLQQSFFSSIATVFIGGVPFEVGTFPVSSNVAKALGAKDLDAEKSVNLSAGFTYSADNFSLTVDGYQISITDRIVLTENFTGGNIPTFLQSKGINANGGRYFTNALDTKTTGIDITTRYGIRLNNESSLRFTLAMNFNKTDITNENDIKTPPELAAVTDIPLLGRVQQGIITEGQPKDSWNFMANYTLQNFDFMIKVLRFGEFKTFDNNELRDQTFGAVWYADFEIAYNVAQGINIAVGSNNILDSYPDKQLKVNSFNGIFPYSSYAPSGFNGRYLYTRVNVRL